MAIEDDAQGRFWTLRVYAGRGKWGEAKTANEQQALEGFKRQIRVMPNCPAELVESRVIMHHTGIKSEPGS